MSADTDISASTNLFGKYIDDLQENVEIGEDAITGTLKYVTGYTGFSGDASQQEGNYLALHFASDVEDATIAVELVGGDVGHPVTLDTDGIIVLRIKKTDEDYVTETVRVTASKEGYTTNTIEYSLEDIVLQSNL